MEAPHGGAALRCATRPLLLLALASLAAARAQDDAGAGAWAGAGLWEREPLTAAGSLRGRVQRTPHGPVAQFLGVRYAAVERRFDAPRPHRVPDPARVVDADAFAPACHQAPASPHLLTTQVAGRAGAGAGAGERAPAEDCLFLNVFAPASPPPPAGRAVLLWLPGDGFSAADPALLDPSALAARADIIVVTAAYRLGALGFLSAGNATLWGNAALADATEALRWVAANAAAFGGDARRLALGGRFTGAVLAALAALATQAQPLATRLLLQSAGPFAFQQDPANNTAALAARLGCQRADFQQTVSCLRGVPASELWAAGAAAEAERPGRWAPVGVSAGGGGGAGGGAGAGVDVVRAARRGAFGAALPVLVGETSNEGALCLLHHFALETAFAPALQADNVTRKDFAQLVRQHLLILLNVGDQALVDAATHEYKVWADSGRNFRALFLRFCGALYVRARAEQLARALAKKGARVWRYEFAHSPSASPHARFVAGAAHGDEVPFALGMLPADAPAAERDLADRLMDAWGNFVAYGNPNVDSGEDWPQFVDASRRLRVFDVVGAPAAAANRTTDFLSQDVDFWGGVVPSLLRGLQRGGGGKAQGRACAKAQKSNPPRTGDCSALSALIALSIILACALLLIGVYLVQTLRGAGKGLLSQEHVPQ